MQSTVDKAKASNVACRGQDINKAGTLGEGGGVGAAGVGTWEGRGMKEGHGTNERGMQHEGVGMWYEGGTQHKGVGQGRA